MTTPGAPTPTTPVSPIPAISPIPPIAAPNAATAPSAAGSGSSPGALGSPQPSGRLDTLFGGLRRSPVTRAPGGKLGGVCAGVAEHLGIAPGIVRLVAVVAAFAGVGIPLYLLAWLLLPDRSGRLHLERAVRTGGSSLVLLVVTVLALLPDDHFHGAAWVAPVGLLVVLAVRKARTRAGARPAASTPVDTVTR